MTNWQLVGHLISVSVDSIVVVGVVCR